jgi:hypothetical protein
MHPALRSRIRGYGYEIYMESTMPDTETNRMKLVRFVKWRLSLRLLGFKMNWPLKIQDELGENSWYKNS